LKPLQAYLIGFRIGDLRVRKFYKNSETIHVDCGSTRREQIELVEKLFDKYGRVWISKPNKKGVIQVECFLNNSFEFLLKIDQNSIPSWIMNNKLYFANFLAGFTDAEGSIFISQNKAFYALGNYNLKLLRQMKKSLMLFGVESRKITRSVRKGFIASHGYKYNSDYWTISISRKKELMKLFTLIEPLLKHAKRIKDLKAAKDNIVLRNQEYGE